MTGKREDYPGRFDRWPRFAFFHDHVTRQHQVTVNALEPRGKVWAFLSFGMGRGGGESSAMIFPRLLISTGSPCSTPSRGRCRSRVAIVARWLFSLCRQ